MRIVRYEFKYFIIESQYREIMGCISRHLVPDPYAKDKPEHRYFVNSLYLDSPSLRYYEEKLTGTKSRHKVRMRCYTPDFFQAGYYFAEIKKRDMAHVDKLRIKLPSRDYHEFMRRGFSMGPDAYTKEGHPERSSMEEILYLCNRHLLEPKTFILYEREAYIADHDDTVRVTFDRSIMCQSYFSALSTHLLGWTSVFPGKIVLEIKVRNLLPFWLHDLVKELTLEHESISKYCGGVERAASFYV